jgi:hypothetical protein
MLRNSVPKVLAFKQAKHNSAFEAQQKGIAETPEEDLLFQRFPPTQREAQMALSLNCSQAIVLTRRTKHSRRMKETKLPQYTYPSKHKRIWRQCQLRFSL